MDEWVGADGARRRKRRLAGVAGATTFCLLSGISLVKLHSRLSGDESTLSAQEWRGLRARWFGERPPQPSTGKAPPPPAADVEIEESFSPPRRLPTPELSPDVRERQLQGFSETRPKDVVELQPFRATSRMEVASSEGITGEAELVNLNPTVNKWYLLRVHWSDGREGSYHLVNENPQLQDLALDPDYPFGLALVDDRGKRVCDLWSGASAASLDAAADSRYPYVSLCGDEVTLRQKTPGRRTALEWATDFLRDSVWAGEGLTVLVRQTIFQDAFLKTSETILAADAPAEADAGPAPASLEPGSSDVLLVSDELGLALADAVDGKVPAGRWLRLRHHPEVFASVIRPDLVDRQILSTHRSRVSALDPPEGEALVYLVAFDLESFALGFALGTEHPRVSWSPRVLETIREPSLPGPDGIDDISPLAATGIVPRAEAHRTIATFTGGFKREHGAFRVSDLAGRNHGSHYGFMEGGAILSKLQPGLATLFVLEDGRVEMKTWSEEDDFLLPRIDSARQNGLPLVERDPETGDPVPGERVSHWAAGNWSGSQDRRLRTVRAGTCLSTTDRGRFLIYAHFSAATPSAMARVFQAYRCEYAMMLDMNALEHTYFAVYHRESEGLGVEHLIRGMEVLDKTAFEQVLPRFLGFADNRDFFYIMRREVTIAEP